MAANALVVHQPAAITVHRDADLYRLGALVLRRLDRGWGGHPHHAHRAV